MPSFYTYLISSLPMLHLGAKPPFSFEKFLGICQDKIPEGQLHIIGMTKDAYAYTGLQPTLQKWRAFEAALRNELVKIRASRKHIDPQRYIRGNEYAESRISNVAMNACRNPSVLEAEEALDQERWRRLDELAVGHFFDLDFLIIYALKLLILERWERINSVDVSLLLKEVLS